MPYTVLSIRNAVYQTIHDANTTSATYPSGGLSEGLTSTGVLTDGNINKARPSNTANTRDRFPRVWVALDNDSEAIDQMGQGAQRHIEGQIAVYCACASSPRSDDAHQEAEDAMAVLCNNVRTALRNNLNMSNTVSFCIPEKVEYNVAVEGMGEGTYVSAGKISLKYELLSV